MKPIFTSTFDYLGIFNNPIKSATKFAFKCIFPHGPTLCILILTTNNNVSMFFFSEKLKAAGSKPPPNQLEEKNKNLNESMVSLVLRQYMRGENVLLIQIGKQNVKMIEK